ncbi:MAG: hypothetical protein KH135_00015 [Firmicutes bacterium]|nr:hypothetical protein [Bacillota bacterium]
MKTDAITTNQIEIQCSDIFTHLAQQCSEYIKFQSQQIYNEYQLKSNYPVKLIFHLNQEEKQINFEQNENEINIYLSPREAEKFPDWVQERCFHKYAEILCQDLKPLWFQKGMTRLLSNPLSHQDMRHYLNQYIFKVGKTIPPISYLEKTETDFQANQEENTVQYDGYALSYMAVSYLKETSTKEEFQSMIANNQELEKIKDHILNDASTYYIQKYHIQFLNEKEITNEIELFDYLAQTMEYGWIGTDGKKYTHTMKPLRETYRIQSVENVFKNHLMTCIEQVRIVSDYCQKWDYPVKQFCFRKYEDKESYGEPILMHCFPIFQKNNHWYHFDYTNTRFLGIHEFNTLKEAIHSVISQYPENDIRILTEIPGNIPEGLSFYEWNLYVNQFPEYQIPLEQKKNR